MNIEQAVLEKLRTLPRERQRQVLEFMESLEDQRGRLRPLRSAKGMLGDLDFDLTEEDIAQARREMWRNFPREFPE